jgi:predicted phosphodiesterase
MTQIKQILFAVWQLCNYVFVQRWRKYLKGDGTTKGVFNNRRKTTMKILQISDIHWTKRKPWNDDFAGMKSRFLVDIKEYIEAGNEIDYIFICGDIAFKGMAEEYDKALEYIDKICKIIDCTRQEVFVVPGNHDLNRKAVGYQTREMINASLAFAPNNENILDEVVLRSGSLRKALFAAFTEYNTFANKFFCQEKLMNKCITGKIDDTIEDSDELFYETRFPKKVGDIDVYIRGVNTALNCDQWDRNEENKDGHTQMLPCRAYVMENERKQELRIIMGHHPIPFLTLGDKVKEYLDNHYHIQLFGHVHKQYVGDGNCVMVQSGAFDPPKGGKAENYLPVYNIIEITQKDSTHVVVKGNSQIWDKNKFVDYKKGSFEKEIEVERNLNKWGTPKNAMEEIDKRNIKFRYMDCDDRTSFFNTIPGVHFTPDTDKTEPDNCLDFLAEVEKMGKLAELNELMK